MLLGALGVVAYRLWGRRRGNDEDDDVMPDKYEADQMAENGTSSGLERYQNPHTQGSVNQAANF